MKTNKQDMKDLAVKYHNNEIDIYEFDKEFDRLWEIREHTHQINLGCARKGRLEKGKGEGKERSHNEQEKE